MTWVIHTFGNLAWFAAALGAIAGLLAWAVTRGRGAKIPVVTAVTVTLAVAILDVSPRSLRRFPTEGEGEWEWRWLGDIPDAMTLHLLNDYTAAIAFLNFALFAGWGVVVAWACGPGRRWLSVAAVVLFPICLEALQRYPFGGTPSVTDAWTNILGGLCGVAIWMGLARVTGRRATMKA